MGKILNTYLNNKPKEIVIKGDGQYIISNKKYLDFTGVELLIVYWDLIIQK